MQTTNMHKISTKMHNNSNFQQYSVNFYLYTCLWKLLIKLCCLLQ